ncbi:nucleolar pre-ribosomal-associated protein 1 isoform X2 [Tachypleus tridentatus]
MMAVCCSYKLGIIFHDWSLGTSGKNENHIITNLLVSVEKPYTDERMFDFVVKVLQTCPDQVKYFVPSLKTALEPRLSPAWIGTVKLVKKIIESQNLIEILSTTNGKLNVNKMISAITSLCAPPVFPRTVLVKHIQERHFWIRHEILGIVLINLTKMENALTCIQSGSLETFYSQADLNKFELLLRKSFHQVLPDISVIQTCLEEVITSGLSASVTEDVAVINEYRPPSIAQHLNRILEVLIGYRTVFPHQEIELKLDSFLAGVKKHSQNMTSEDLALVQLQALNLVSTCTQSLCILEEGNLDSPIILLLDVFQSTKDSDLKRSAKSIIVSILIKTGLFDGCEWELDIWLENMIQIQETSHTKVSEFFEASVKEMLSKSNYYMDMILESSMESVSDCVQKTRSIVDLEDLLRKIRSKKECKTGKNGELDEQIEPHFMPFSVLVPASLNVFEECDEVDETIAQFLISVSKDILFNQCRPETLTIILSRSKKLLLHDILEYVKLWIPRTLKFKLSLCQKMSNLKLKSEGMICARDYLEEIFFSFQKKKDNLPKKVSRILQKTFKLLSSLHTKEKTNLVTQLLFYVHTILSRNQNKEDIVKEVTTYFDLLKAILADHLDFKKYTNVNESLSGQDKPEKNSIEQSESSPEAKENDNYVSFPTAALQLVFAHPKIISCFLMYEKEADVTQDVVQAGVTQDVVQAGVTQDVVQAGVTQDVVQAGVTQDVVQAGVTQDVVQAGVTQDVVQAGVTQDVVQAGVTQDVVQAGVTQDVVQAGVTRDVVQAGVTQDVVQAGVTRDVVQAGVTQDVVQAGVTQDVVHLITTFYLKLIGSLEDILMAKPNLCGMIKPFMNKVQRFLEENSVKAVHTFVMEQEKPFNLQTLLMPFLNFIDRPKMYNLLEALFRNNSLETLRAIDPEFMIIQKLLQKLTVTDHNSSGRLSSSCVSALFHLYATTRREVESAQLGKCLLDFLTQYPLYCTAVEEKTLLCIIEKFDVERLKIVEFLARSSPAHLQICKHWLSLHQEDLISRDKIAFIYFINLCFPPSWIPGTLEKSLYPVITQFWSIICENLREPQLVIKDKNILDYTSTLIYKLSTKKLIDSDMILQLVEFIYSDVVENGRILRDEQIKLALWLFRSCTVLELKVAQVEPAFALTKVLLISLIKALNQNAASKEALVEMLIDAAEETVKSTDAYLVQQACSNKEIWFKLVKVILKNSMRIEDGNLKLLSLLKNLCHIIYTQCSESFPFSGRVLYEMIIGHSNFLTVLLEEQPGVLNHKEAILDILITLVTVDGSLCMNHHVPMLLGGYHASLHKLDQKILYLLMLFEKHGAQLFNFKPFLWGQAAIGHYSLKKNIGLSLLKQPRMEEVLNLLDDEKMVLTALKFPLNLELQPKPPEEKLHQDDKENEKLYDPCFLLPFLTHLLTPGSLVHFKKFIEMNCLGLAFAALSSYDSSMRAAGYTILSSFYQHLEGSFYKDKRIWLVLLDSVKNSLEKSNTRLPCIITMFLVKVTQLMFKPADPLFRPIYQFLMLKPALDLGNVPEFYKLFYSNDLQFRLHQSWVLTLLCEGTRTSLDFHVCQKRYIFNILLTYYNSVLCIRQHKVLILKSLITAVETPSSAQILCKQHGLLAWLHSAIINCEDSSHDLLCQLVLVLHKLWISSVSYSKSTQNLSSTSVFYISREPNNINLSHNQDDTTEVLENCSSKLNDSQTNVLHHHNFYQSFPSEFLLTHLSLLSKLREIEDLMTIHNYFEALAAVLHFIAEKALEPTGNNLFITSVHNLLSLWSLKLKKYLQEERATCLSFDEQESSRDDEITLVFKCRRLLLEILLHWKPYDNFNEILPNDLCSQTVEDTFIKVLRFQLEDNESDSDINKCSFFLEVTSWINRCLTWEGNQCLILALLSDSDSESYSCIDLLFRKLICMIKLYYLQPCDSSTTEDISLTVCVKQLMNNLALIMNGLNNLSTEYSTFVALANSHFYRKRLRKIIQKLCNTESVTDLSQMFPAITIFLELWIRKPKPILYKICHDNLSDV